MGSAGAVGLSQSGRPDSAWRFPFSRQTSNVSAGCLVWLTAVGAATVCGGRAGRFVLRWVVRPDRSRWAAVLSGREKRAGIPR